MKKTTLRKLLPLTVIAAVTLIGCARTEKEEQKVLYKWHDRHALVH